MAPFVLTHRVAPAGQSPRWPHDASCGDFRDSPLARNAIAPLVQAVEQLRARCVLFKTPELFSPSAANRDTLRAFFSTVVPAEAFPCARVWLPGGLWEVNTALAVARDLGVVVAFDPTVRAPLDPPDIHYDLEAAALYFRVEHPGRSGAMTPQEVEDLATLIEHYEGTEITVAFASSAKWADARNLQKLILSGEGSHTASEDEG